MTDHAEIVATAGLREAPAAAPLTGPASRARERKGARGVPTARPPAQTARDAHTISIANETRPTRHGPRRGPRVRARPDRQAQPRVRRASETAVDVLVVVTAHGRDLPIAAILAVGAAATELVLAPARLAEMRVVVRLRPLVTRRHRAAEYRSRRTARNADASQAGRSSVALIALAAAETELAAGAALTLVCGLRGGVGGGLHWRPDVRRGRRGNSRSADEASGHEERERRPCKPHQTRSHAWLGNTDHTPRVNNARDLRSTLRSRGRDARNHRRALRSFTNLSAQRDEVSDFARRALC